MNCKFLPGTISYAVTVAMTLVCASSIAADTPSYEETVTYIEEKSTVKDIQPNEYYNPKKESKRHSKVKEEIFRKIQFPENCVMEFVSEHFQEVAPPTSSNLDNNYGFSERQTLTVKLDKLVPSKIYSTSRGPDRTVVIIKSRKGGMVQNTELFYDQPGNTNMYGVSMQKAIEYSVDSPFGKLECSNETCTRSRRLNGYGIAASENKYTDGLRDALINIVKICGGTG